MDEQTQSTDVGGNGGIAGFKPSSESFNTPTATVEASTSTAAAPVSQSENNQTANAGGVTAQSVIEATENDTGTVEPAQEADPLEGVPTLEELEQNKTQQYAQALINLRTAYEARKAKDAEVQGTLTAVQPLIEKYGDANALQARLDAYDSLFEQVVDPATQQPQFDETGLPRVSAAKFIEQVDAENPGMAETMLNDLLRYAPEFNGQKVSFYERALREVYGLDPQKLDAYRNIDALTAPTGEVTPEELETIPKELHDAFKSLPAEVREDLKEAKPAARDQYLRDRQRVLAVEQHQQEQARAQTEAQQQQIATARQQIVEAQDSYVSEQLQQGYATIMDDLASKVTFSGDAAQNAAMQCQIGALLNSLRDSDFRQANAQRLEAMGIKLGSDFDEALTTADKHLRDAKAYELMGQKGLAQTSLTKASAAKNQVLAKLAPIALRAAKASGGALAAKANGQNQSLQSATTMRPTPGNNGTQAEPNGFLPAGMMPNDPRAGIEIARRTGLLR